MKLRLFVMLCLSGTVSAQSMPLPPVIDHSTYPEVSEAAPKSASASTFYEILARMEQLQMEVQQLRGTVEEQAYAIAELKNRQSTIYNDLDGRLQALEIGGATQQPAAAPLEPVVPGATLVPSKTPEQILNPFAAVAPVQSSASPASVKNEKERYQQAYEILKNGHYAQAIAEFNRFLIDYPSGEYADNAQYWLGEAYKVTQSITAARKAFNKVVSDYPKSPKVRDALLKLGYIEYDRKNIQKAREYFSQITARYPGTTAANLATKKLQQMQ